MCVIPVVGDEGEFELVARIVRRLADGAAATAGGGAGVLLGPGDDAAVVAAADGRVVATTDLLLEGRHFRLDWSSGYDVGRKAAAQNLADVVAMGAVPTALLVGLGVRADLPVSWVEALADGFRDECAAAGGASVVGGDVARSDSVVVAVTALGDLHGRAPVTRSGCRPGDAVVVVGRLGWAAAGLALLLAGRPDDPLADAHRRPAVPYAAGQELARGGVTAMIDVSDGLVADLGHLADASGVLLELRASDLPVASELVAAGRRLGVDPLTWVAGGGDDHAFAATVPVDALPRVTDRLAGLTPPCPPVRIGSVAALPAGAPGAVRFSDRTPPGPAGHDHFAS